MCSKVLHITVYDLVQALRVAVAILVAGSAKNLKLCTVSRNVAEARESLQLWLADLVTYPNRNTPGARHLRLEGQGTAHRAVATG